MAEAGDWLAWQDANGDAMFVADGAKMPVLIRVTDGGQNEQVLATFVSVDAAGAFQDWLSQAFEDTGMANNQMSLALRGQPSTFTRADARENEGYRGPLG